MLTMRSSADDVWMTYVPADNVRMMYSPADDMQMMFRMTYVICQRNLQRNLTLMSSARHPHEISTPKIFPLKEQTALLMKEIGPRRGRIQNLSM